MRFSILLLLCGCQQLLGFEDLAPDDAGDLPDGKVCVGSARSLTGTICLANIDGPLEVEGVLETSSSSVCNPAVSNVCLIAAQSIEVGGTLRVRGSRPLVLWSASTISIRKSSVLDIRSVDGLGPGANDDDCPLTDGTFDQSTDTLVGTGGCGGPFGSAGGNAGDGNAVNEVTVSVDCSNQTLTLDRVRGGCAGGSGGLVAGFNMPNGGSAAGGVYLMAATSITVAGMIDARGTPGTGGPGVTEAFAGGGGGGSGGLIGLDAPKVVLDDAVLNALGGGGASGAGLSGGVKFGIPGEDSTLDPPTNATSTASIVGLNFGGASGMAGGNVESDQTGGGGGGGGGAGYIVVLSADVQLGSAQIAPPLSSL